MTTLLYFIWNVDPEIFSIGSRPIRWYGLLFALGFLISQQILIRMFKSEVPDVDKLKKQAEKDVETLTVYIVIATIIGARLGHVLFYEPDKYLANPISIIKIWEGGLASHGAGIAIFIAMWLFARQRKKDWTFLKVADRIAIVVAITGALIRFGNLMNSEIYGHPSESEYGFVFSRFGSEALTSSSSPVEDVSFTKHDKIAEGIYVPITANLTFERGTDDNQQRSYIENNVPNIFGGRYSYISDHVTMDTSKPIEYTISGRSATIELLGVPRHPTQLYESITSFLLFILLLYLWNLRKEKTPSGRIFGLFLVLLFSMRFVHEFFKVNQVDFENNIPLNMGQWLSIPMVIWGLYILINSFKNKSYGTGS